jgi:hypothetical protein
MNDGKRKRILVEVAEQLGLKLLRIEDCRKMMKVYFTDGRIERYVTYHRSPSCEPHNYLRQHLIREFSLRKA